MKIKCLVFSGGAIRGITYIGCLKALEEYEIIKDVSIMSGSSAGAIFALLIILGYTSQQLESLCLQLDFEEFKDITSDSLLSFTINYGIDTGDKLMRLISILIKKKTKNSDITLQELYDLTKIKFIITGTCVNTHSTEYFSYESNPDMKVLDAIRITISIPLIYNAFHYNNKIYVDGGILDNYPIHLFNEHKKNTIGFLINAQENLDPCNLTNYIIALLMCVSKRLDKYQMVGFEKQTILLKINHNAINYSISEKVKKNIINIGYENTKKYIEDNFLSESNGEISDSSEEGEHNNSDKEMQETMEILKENNMHNNIINTDTTNTDTANTDTTNTDTANTDTTNTDTVNTITDIVNDGQHLDFKDNENNIISKNKIDENDIIEDITKEITKEIPYNNFFKLN